MHGSDGEDPSASGHPAARHPALSAADLRGAPRFALIMRVAKLVIDGREQFCVIRDVSETGLKVKVFGPLSRDAELAVELANGDRHAAQCVWIAGDHAGLKFAEPIAIARLLDEAKGTGQRHRVRLRIALDGILHAGGEVVPVAFRDISQQGAAIDSEKWLLLNQLVKIETTVLPVIYAKVRWRDHPRYGLIFEQTFRLEELAQLCADLPAPHHAAPDRAGQRADPGHGSGDAA